jgi:hypothetical protein
MQKIQEHLEVHTMRKIMFIIFAVMLLAITGCAAEEKAVKTDDAGTSASIAEADDIAGIEDAQADKEVSDAESSLDSW